MALSAECSRKCNCLLLEAVNENSISKLQSAKRNYSEIEILTGLTQSNEEGETPLLVAIQAKNVLFIEELLTVLKKFTRKTNKCQSMSPMCLVVIDQLSKQIPIMELIEYLIKDLTDKDWLEFIAKVFIKSTSFTQQDRIIALELIGASILCSHLTSLQCLERYEYCAALRWVGLQCWREAMTLRFAISDALPKTLAVCAASAASSVVFGSVVEVMTIDELDLLEEHIKRNSLSTDYYVRLQCQKLMHRQALLVIRRTCSQANQRYPYWIYLKGSLSLGSAVLCWNLGREFRVPDVDMNIVINTCHFILEQMNEFDPKLLSLKSFNVLIETLNLMSCYFLRWLMEDERYVKERKLFYANLLKSTKLIETVANLFSNPATISSVKFEYFCFADIVYRFLFVLKSFSPLMTLKGKKKLEEFYSNFIQNLFPERTTTVLHVAIQETNTIFQRLIVDGTSIGYGIPKKLKSVHRQIKLILNLGADPNAIDEYGRTPLHILAGMKKHHLNKYLPIFKTLVNAGSDLYATRDNGETVLNILKKNLIRHQKTFTKPIHPYFESFIYTVFPLSCYAARVIRRHRIQFDKDRLPRTLQTFIFR